jgi:hypothetical protein
MKWIILIGDEKFDLNAIKGVEHYGSVCCYEVVDIQDRYCVDYGEDHIFYDYNNTVINDYEGDELNEIPFTNPHFIMMAYTSDKLVRNVLSQNNFLKNIWIDNDNGIIVSIEDFINLGMPVSER